MSETLIPIPKSSLEKLLKPVNRLTDSCVLRTENESIYTVCSSGDNSVILYAVSKIPIELKDIKLNIINIKKLLTGLDCLGNDGEFKLIHSENHIVCKCIGNSSEENTHFKYHLVDDNIIKEATVNSEKIRELTFDTTFDLSLSKIKQIMSAYSFVGDANKIYFYTKESKVHADVDDKTLQNIDNVSLIASNEFKGDEIITPISIKIEIFKLLSSSKSSIKVKINNKFKVFIFETEDDENTQLKYIISALVK